MQRTSTWSPLELAGARSGSPSISCLPMPRSLFACSDSCAVSSVHILRMFQNPLVNDVIKHKVAVHTTALYT